MPTQSPWIQYSSAVCWSAVAAPGQKLFVTVSFREVGLHEMSIESYSSAFPAEVVRCPHEHAWDFVWLVHVIYPRFRCSPARHEYYRAIDITGPMHGSLVSGIHLCGGPWRTTVSSLSGIFLDLRLHYEHHFAQLAPRNERRD